MGSSLRRVIVPLDGSIHDRTAFDCGEVLLNQYLARSAAQGQRDHASQTYVVVDDDAPQPKEIHAYVTLATTMVYIASSQTEKAREIPAILLCRLGVHNPYKGLGLGRLLVDYTFRVAKQASTLVGCAAILVDPKPGVSEFYSRLGFEVLEQDTGRMSISLKKAIKRLEQAHKSSDAQA